MPHIDADELTQEWVLRSPTAGGVVSIWSWSWATSRQRIDAKATYIEQSYPLTRGERETRKLDEMLAGQQVDNSTWFNRQVVAREHLLGTGE